MITFVTASFASQLLKKNNGRVFVPIINLKKLRSDNVILTSTTNPSNKKTKWFLFNFSKNYIKHGL